jgi:hypothetical protein
MCPVGLTVRKLPEKELDSGRLSDASPGLVHTLDKSSETSRARLLNKTNEPLRFLFCGTARAIQQIL